MTEKIVIENIGKQFHLPGQKGPTTLDGIDLSVSEGEFVVILGRSGCGKSTLLNIIAGTLSPSAGEVRVDGERVEGPHPSRSILFQQPSLLPWLTVEENIAFGCKLRGDEAELGERVARYMELIHLTGFETYMPASLSLGMCQRICLARALIGMPDILLMDEPFGALDTFTRSTLQEELIQIWQRQGFTVFFVTHDIDEALLTGTKIVLLGGPPGRIVDRFEIDLPHPRNSMDPSFLEIKKRILEKFKESMA